MLLSCQMKLLNDLVKKVDAIYTRGLIKKEFWCYD